VDEDIAIAQRAVKGMGLSLEVLSATTNHEIDIAFARAVELRIDALAIVRSQFFSDRRVQLTTSPCDTRSPRFSSNVSFRKLVV
jgi:hypothetical protein